MNRMEWPSLEELTAWAPMPAGNGYKPPSREDVPRLIAAIENWYSNIAVGAASGFGSSDMAVMDGIGLIPSTRALIEFLFPSDLKPPLA
jgi:hypothetical protein